MRKAPSPAQGGLPAELNSLENFVRRVNCRSIWSVRLDDCGTLLLCKVRHTTPNPDSGA